MNLRPPPHLTGDLQVDVQALSQWANEAYEFLKYPHFHQIRLISRADPSESQSGVVYLDSDDNKIKGHDGTGFQNFY